MTLNEVFARNDYEADGEDQVIVDTGSNIGVSSPISFRDRPRASSMPMSLYPRISDGCGITCAVSTSRYRLYAAPLGPKPGGLLLASRALAATVAWESTTGESIEVECLAATRSSRALRGKHGTIDIFKADVEGYEEKVLRGIEPGLLRRMRKIFVEWTFTKIPYRDSPLPAIRQRRAILAAQLAPTIRPDGWSRNHPAVSLGLRISHAVNYRFNVCVWR